MAISRTPVYKTKHLPINNVWTPVYERTDLHQIADMTDFIRNVAKAADAAAVRKLIDAAATNHGLHVPAGGDETKFLRGDNTWQTINNIIGGGIVAQSLAQNGWVKFSNGLIIQWIRDDGDYNEHLEVVFTFPIAFSTCFWAGALGWANNRYGGSYQSGGVKWFNNTQFAHVGADNGSCSMLVLALGI